MVISIFGEIMFIERIEVDGFMCTGYSLHYSIWFNRLFLSRIEILIEDE